MADNKTKTGVQDQARINFNEEYEVHHWTASLSVNEATLRGAVQAVGDRVDDVREYLRNR